jgi:AcrR family transcriptional regulator
MRANTRVATEPRPARRTPAARPDDATTRRKRPRQARSKAMVTAILDAAARVVRTDGDDHLTTNRVAEVAGVSVGSLYQYFPNKAALLVALLERHDAEMWAVFTITPPPRSAGRSPRPCRR